MSSQRRSEREEKILEDLIEIIEGMRSVEVRDIRDRLATIKKVEKDIYKIAFEYEANNIRAVKYYDEAGNLLLTLVFTYDAAGNLISIERGG